MICYKKIKFFGKKPIIVKKFLIKQYAIKFETQNEINSNN